MTIAVNKQVLIYLAEEVLEDEADSSGVSFSTASFGVMDFREININEGDFCEGENCLSDICDAYYAEENSKFS